MRAVFQWSIGTRVLELGKRTRIMGIVNVTPDSFSDGGLYLDAGKATAHALQLLDEGADIIDVGGESTRPGARAATVSAEEELRRVLPVITALKKQRPDAVISIDTYKASLARAAVNAGAEIVNDVSGLRWDKQMARAIADMKCGAILMHMRGRPEDWQTLPPPGDVGNCGNGWRRRCWLECAGNGSRSIRALASGNGSSRTIRCWGGFRTCNRWVFRSWREHRESPSWDVRWRRTGTTLVWKNGSTAISRRTRR